MKKLLLATFIALFGLTALKADDFNTPQTLGGTTTLAGKPSSETNIAIYKGHLAVAFVETVSGNENISLWIDDGEGGSGVADDGIVNGDEVRKSFIKKKTLVYSNGSKETHPDWGADLAMRVVNGKISMAFRAYGDNKTATISEIYTWHDFNDDLIVGQGEWDEHDKDYQEDSRSLDVAYTNRFVITSVFKTNNRLVLGHDDNADHSQPENGIVSQLEGSTTGMAYNSMVSHGGVINLFYQDTATSEVRLWNDTNGNFKDNESYVLIDDVDSPGINIRAAVLDGKLAVSYHEASGENLRWWVDANNNYAVDAGETGSITGTNNYGKYSDILSFNGHTTIVFTKQTVSGLSLCMWSDDGAMSSTADDNIAQTGEIRELSLPAIKAGNNCRAVESGGKLYITYTDETNSECKFVAYSLSDAPVMTAQSFDIDENKPNHTKVGKVAATADHPLYSEVASDGVDYFYLDSEGNIFVEDNVILDYETGPNSYEYKVKVEDEVTHAFVIKKMTINIEDVIEVVLPDASIDAQSFDLDETVTNDTVVGSVVYYGDGISITGGNGQGFFEIDDHGNIVVTDDLILDFDINPVITLEVTVTDSATNSDDTATITINLEEFIEPTKPISEFRGIEPVRKHHDQFTMHKINPCVVANVSGGVAFALLILVASLGLAKRERRA